MQTEIYKPMKRIFLLLSLLALSAASLSAQVLLKGAEEYFTPEQMPNMLKWLPAPPTEGSAAFAYDEAQYQWGKEQRNDKARAALAIAHASIDPAKICEHFSEAMGMTISKENTPAIYRVGVNGMETANNISIIPKKHYNRQRPFIRYGEPTIVPKAEKVLSKNGSYPSGHTIIGFSGALLLAEINPDAADELIKIGYECGQSRIISGFHWQSDVTAARLAAAVAVAKLHSSKQFNKDMRRAKREFEKKR